MHKDLEAWLNQVWSEKARIIGLSPTGHSGRVALGMEPPGLAVIRSGGEYYAEEMGQSFGFYRAMLIFMALDRTHFTRAGQTDQQRCAAFKNRAAKYLFTQAGIDPDRPAEQSEPKDLKPIEELDRTIQGDPDDVGGVKVVIRH